jgi:hypothetical protein
VHLLWHINGKFVVYILNLLAFIGCFNRFIVDIYKTEDRKESRQFINKIQLEFPKVLVLASRSKSFLSQFCYSFWNVSRLSYSIKQLCRCLSKMGTNVEYMFFTSSNLFFRTKILLNFFETKGWKKISGNWCGTFFQLKIPFIALPCKWLTNLFYLHDLVWGWLLWSRGIRELLQGYPFIPSVSLTCCILLFICQVGILFFSHLCRIRNNKTEE